MFRYKTSGTCSQIIEFEVDEYGKMHSLSFTGGCRGNLQGVAKLCEGRNIDEIAATLKGTLCRNGTSCPDQLAKAIEAYKQQNK
ncbi:MAG: TIGR03905 family TSCPD domain-containing protein [Clostridia bacterium]|nr:TIGR03905 family TSCPD domain-containing protein [Clostridia bacterium]